MGRGGSTGGGGGVRKREGVEREKKGREKTRKREIGKEG